MEPTGNEREPKGTTEALAETVRNLTTDQIRFVVARQEYGSDKEAAEALGISPQTVKHWKHGGAPIDKAVRLMALDGIVVATELRRRNLAKAMAVKVAGLDEQDARLRQAVATEVIEWEMGKATQRQEIKGETDNRLVVTYVDDWRSNTPTNAPSGADSD